MQSCISMSGGFPSKSFLLAVPVCAFSNASVDRRSLDCSRPYIKQAVAMKDRKSVAFKMLSRNDSHKVFRRTGLPAKDDLLAKVPKYTDVVKEECAWHLGSADVRLCLHLPRPALICGPVWVLVPLCAAR